MHMVDLFIFPLSRRLKKAIYCWFTLFPDPEGQPAGALWADCLPGPPAFSRLRGRVRSGCCSSTSIPKESPEVNSILPRRLTTLFSQPHCVWVPATSCPPLRPQSGDISFFCPLLHCTQRFSYTLLTYLQNSSNHPNWVGSFLSAHCLVQLFYFISFNFNLYGIFLVSSNWAPIILCPSLNNSESSVRLTEMVPLFISFFHPHSALKTLPQVPLSSKKTYEIIW